MLYRKLKYLAFFKLLLLLSADVASGIYKWTDENGNVHFSDKKPNHEQASEVKLKINTYKSVSYDRSIFNTGKKVVIYSTSWCVYCQKAKKYFKRKGIKFTEYDIEKSKQAKRRYLEMGASGVPVILVGDNRMNGFSEEGFERIYH